MDPNRLTVKTQEALHDAQTKALRYGHTEVDTAHLLLALLEQPEGLVPRLLARADVDTGALRAAVERRSNAGRGSAGPEPPAASSVSRARSGSCSTPPSRRPQRLKDEYVSVEHVLLAMLGIRARHRRRQPAARARRRPRPDPRTSSPRSGVRSG